MNNTSSLLLAPPYNFTGRLPCIYQDPYSLQVMALVCYDVLIPIMAVFGLLGNSLTLAVYSPQKQAPRTVLAVSLFTLMIWDTVVLMSALFVFTLPRAIVQIGRSLPIFFGITHMARTASIWTSALVVMERFVAVTFPMKHQLLYPSARGKYMMLGVAAMAMMYSLPRFFEFVAMILPVCGPPGGSFIVIPNGRAHRMSDYYKLIYILFFHCILLFAFPFLLILILNILIYRAIRQAYAARQSMNARRQKELSTTLMLFAEAVVFLVCNTPSLLMNYMETSHVDWLQKNPHRARFIQHASNVLAVTKCASNFPVFWIFGSRFRKKFRQRICHCAHEADGRYTTTNNVTARRYGSAFYNGGAEVGLAMIGCSGGIGGVGETTDLSRSEYSHRERLLNRLLSSPDRERRQKVSFDSAINVMVCSERDTADSPRPISSTGKPGKYVKLGKKSWPMGWGPRKTNRYCHFKDNKKTSKSSAIF